MNRYLATQSGVLEVQNLIIIGDQQIENFSSSGILPWPLRDCDISERNNILRSEIDSMM